MLNNIENIVFKSMNTFVIQLNISKHKMTYILQYIVYKDSNVFKSLTKDHGHINELIPLHIFQEQ